jgi:hypothetical protein
LNHWQSLATHSNSVNLLKEWLEFYGQYVEHVLHAFSSYMPYDEGVLNMLQGLLNSEEALVLTLQ